MVERISKLSIAVFLLCLAAIVPLVIAEWYSGQDAPNETLELYDTLENILGWLLFASLCVPLLLGLGREFGWLSPVCAVLGGLALWYMSSYLEARGALKDVCNFVSREAVKLPDETRVMGEEPVATLRAADDTCFEQRALPRSRY
jgi:hypothetical protein